jgi:hypothetical protein
MPTYIYTTEDGETEVRTCPVAKRPSHVFINGKKAFRDLTAEHATKRRTSGDKMWPMRSVGFGVAAEQAEDAQEEMSRLGVPTEFDKKTGDAVFRTRRHRKQALAAMNMHDRDGGPGD